MRLLHIDSSILGPLSVSRELSGAVVSALRRAQPQLEVTYRDLVATPTPQFGPAAAQALKLGKPTGEGQDDLKSIEVVLNEFLAADMVVIGVPMYNFGVPSQLKSWIDALAQPGRTFKYTPEGPRGLAGSKRIILASSRGNTYSKPPMNVMDFQEPYLVAVFKFFGIIEIDIVRAEGVNLGPQQREAALRQAHEQIAALIGSAAIAQADAWRSP